MKAETRKAPATSPPLPSGRWPGWFREAFADVPETFQHTVALVLSIVSIWVVHQAFGLLLGDHAKFFDYIPIKWAFDAAHLAVFIRFVWKLVRQIWTD
jgi:hypothetical protein